MAKYKRRPKVKRYRRSFYSRGMRIRKIVGIVVLVAVVLAAAWFAAPHVLDWATHTWYTVVKDRDLEAESASRAAASSQAGFGSCVGGCFLGGIGAGRGRL
jgi:alkanesulfonate monooxygenase SsuD/methylene tetrahydromethanopterin reductase-like flavin-dependent oxidoreductase (luciferase family)